MSPDALTGLEANLRFDGPENMETRIFGRLTAWQNWIFQRPNAVGEKGALKVYGKGEKAAVRLEPRLTQPNRTPSMSTIDYSEKIPNNVNLGRRPHAAARARAVAAELHQLVGRHRPRGLDRLRRLPAHRDQRRPAGLGALRLREDARLPLGHLPRTPATPNRKIHFGDHKGETAWQDVPGEHRANLRRIIVTQGDTEPASVEQQRHLGLTAPSHVRPAQPVPDQRRGRPPPVGDGLPAAHATSAATAARKPRRCSSAARGDAEQPAHPRRVQREDARLAGVLHVHLLHRPRRQVPALRRSPRAASIRWRARRKFMLTEEAHHMFVGESGVSRVIAAHLRR